MNHSSEEMENGLDCYDPESRVFPRIAGSRQAPRLSKRDVLLILKWKLGRIKDSNSETVADDKMAAINQAVEDAAHSDREIAALSALCRVPGYRVGRRNRDFDGLLPGEVHDHRSTGFGNA